MNENLPDNPQIQVLKSGKTGLFTNYIYKAIPLAFDESMSYYETLCGLLNYLKNVVIPTVNNNADAVAELQTLYEQLRTYVDDYFTNLDVQEEINNKLDEMVEDGSLYNIINRYMTPIINTQNQRISNIDNKVNSVASGSPAGVYATETDLINADPNHNRIYIVAENGYWYYYNGNSWTQGGIYQSSESVTDKELISSDKSANAQVTGYSFNIIDEIENIKNNRINTLIFEQGTIDSAGVPLNENTRIRTDYIFCRKGSSFVAKDGYSFFIAKYRINKQNQFIERIENTSYVLNEDCYCRFVLKKTNNAQIQPNESNNFLYNYYELSNNEILVDKILQKINNAYMNADGTLTSHTNYYTLKIDVVENEILKLYFENRSVPIIVAFDDNNNVVKNYGYGTAENPITNTYLQIENNISYIYVNCRTSIDAIVKNIINLNDYVLNFKIPELKLNYQQITVGSCNLGQFNYGDSSKTKDYYLKNWKQMLNDSNFDIFNCQEFINHYSDTINTQQEIFNPLVNNYYKNGLQATESKVQINSNEILDIGSNYYAIKSFININGKEIVSYNVYAHWGAGYESIRQTQYQNLINDAEQYNYVIISGDLNAQNTSEYQIFKDNGFDIANGGYLGDFETLRDITADNIIIKNMKFKNFKVLDYDLNTDHKPIVATIIFN